MYLMLENLGRLRNKIHLNVFIFIIDGTIPVFLYTDTSSLNTDSASVYCQTQCISLLFRVYR